MPGIPPKLRARLCKTLMRCGPFDSNRALQAIFTDARINPWRDRLPDSASHREQRVTALIDALYGRSNAQGESALLLLLEVLSDQSRPDTACHRDLTALAEALQSPTPVSLGPSSPTKTLAERLDPKDWQQSQQVAIQAVVAGGIAAMSLYRESDESAELMWPIELSEQKLSKNPSTLADLQATVVIIQTINLYLEPLARDLKSQLYYLGEETRFRPWLRRRLTPSVFNMLRQPEYFFQHEENTIRVIFDAIDGTVNFTLGLPLFCSGLAVLIDDQVRISAIYDPFHHLVYTGMLKGPEAHPEVNAEAWELPVPTRHRVDLVELARQTRHQNQKKPLIGIHLTRSHNTRLHEFLGANSIEDQSQLEALAREFGGIYALNSGILAMVEVARGAFGGFVNNITNPWDVAPGEVIVKACGGKVTDMRGHPIDYTSQAPLSVVAAGDEATHQKLLRVLISS